MDAGKAAPEGIVHTGSARRPDEPRANFTLEHDLQALQKQGWSIQYGGRQGTFADRTKKSIHVDPSHQGTRHRCQKKPNAWATRCTSRGLRRQDSARPREQYIDGNVNRTPQRRGRGDDHQPRSATS